jgi:predicted component of type VI protein secretion system
MARGWESKSVEQQQEEMAAQRKSVRERTARALISPSPSPGQQQHIRKREGLLLSRARLTQQLQTASHPRHRQMLEQAIAELDRQLSFFEQVPDPTSRK